MKKILFAGASNLFELFKIIEMSLKHNICIEYIETPNLIGYLNDDDVSFVEFGNNITATYDYIVPLNEYWVTKCKEARVSNISNTAFEATRSKTILSDIMQANGLDFCHHRLIDDRLIHEIVDENKKYIIKPDGLYSGQGVAVLEKDNITQIDDFLKAASTVKASTRDILNISDNEPICVEYIDGAEYSADVFIYQGNSEIVRVCKKKTKIIENRPCTLGYLLVEHHGYDKILKRWCETLFDEGDISFAQFDFIIERESGKAIPIDFSCRIGGGLKNLFVTGNNNVYLYALKNSFEGETRLRSKISSEVTSYNNCQLNLIPNRSGVVKNSCYSIIDGVIVSNKRKNDTVTKSYSSTSNRLAEIILHINSEHEFDAVTDKCIVGDEYIESDKEATFRYIKYALEFSRLEYDGSRLFTKINRINTYQDILNIPSDDELHRWKACLVYNLLGFDAYKNCSLNKQSSSTYILFPPVPNKLEYISPILTSDIYATETFNIHFSRKLVATIYGGFPWFESYVRFIKELDFIGKGTICIQITKKDGSDVLAELINYKNRFREENPHCVLKKGYDNEFPGLVNPFHTPNPIENDVHSKIINEEIRFSSTGGYLKS